MASGLSRRRIASRLNASAEAAAVEGMGKGKKAVVARGVLEYDEEAQEHPRYDVFINNCGVDTKRTVARLLYDQLVQCRGEGALRAFLADNMSMRPGDRLEERIDSAISAIRDCIVAVTIFSPRYCDSEFCLRELAMLVEARKTIIPIFYDIEPSELVLPQAVIDSNDHLPRDIERFRFALREAKRTFSLIYDSTTGYVRAPFSPSARRVRLHHAQMCEGCKWDGLRTARNPPRTGRDSPRPHPHRPLSYAAAASSHRPLSYAGAAFLPPLSNPHDFSAAAAGRCPPQASIAVLHKHERAVDADPLLPGADELLAVTDVVGDGQQPRWASPLGVAVVPPLGFAAYSPPHARSSRSGRLTTGAWALLQQVLGLGLLVVVDHTLAFVLLQQSAPPSPDRPDLPSCGSGLGLVRRCFIATEHTAAWNWWLAGAGGGTWPSW